MSSTTRHLLSHRRRLVCTASLVLLLCTHCLEGQSGATIVPHRYIVVYRNAVVPGDAEFRAHSIGTRLLQRNERFGMAVFASSADLPSPNDDVQAMSMLAAQPNVEYVLHDRLVTTGRLTIRQGFEPSFTVVLGPVHPVSPGSGAGNPPAATLPTVPAIQSDRFYNSPQGWAVRQVGGYGNGVAGGPLHGPWDDTMGKGVRIAVLDSGVDASHPDIAPNLTLNLSEVDQVALPSPCDDGSPQDQTGHGTWTASLAAGAQGVGTGDVMGVAPAATLLNIKVLERLPASGIAGEGGASLAVRCNNGEAGGLLSWLIQGIEDAMANRADVISMSLGTIVDMNSGEGAGLKAAVDRVTDAASQAGIVLVAAAGNDGYDLSNPRYLELPAQARGVLAIVASTNLDCAQDLRPGATCAAGQSTLAYYSNYGAPLQALAAPGGSYPSGGDAVVSGWVRGACSRGIPKTSDGPPSDALQSYGCFNLGHTPYVQAIGTSAAAPLAAGVAALIRSAHSDWSAAKVIATMRSSAAPAQGLPVGQVNAVTALAAGH